MNACLIRNSYFNLGLISSCLFKFYFTILVYDNSVVVYFLQVYLTGILNPQLIKHTRIEANKYLLVDFDITLPGSTE